jgi:beta-lactamase class A
MLLPRLRECEVRERMRWSLRLLLVPIGAIGIVAGLAVAHPPLAVAPPIETPYSEPPQLPSVQSIEDLYQMRDQLRNELDEPSAIPSQTAEGAFSTPTKRLQMLQAVEIRIQVEETAAENWDQAIRLSLRAQEIMTTAADTGDTSVETVGIIYDLWKQSVNALKEVPEGSFLEETAAAKLKEYENYLAAAAYKYDTARSDFLRPIAERTGLPLDSVHITVCHLEGECRRWNGNVPPASPASLIKVPVAIALMQKVVEENIDLDTKVLVSRGNYTEDASDIWVGAEYPLRKILTRMINQSSNIATNQLIDFVGRDYINQVMRDRGYRVTTVNTKLVGESIYPANTGVGPNDITMDELTEMMRQIFRQDHPGDDVLIEALASQYDTVLGYDGLRNSSAIWMGEKTGQNSKVLGTTLAMKIGEDYYILSLALDYSGNERAIRQCVNDIANYISRQGHL